jgi:MFS family permease
MEQKSSFCHRRFYYGWVIVGLSMISMSFWFGLRTTFSVFFVALIDHFHWSRAEAAGAQSIALFVYTAISPVVGVFVDRIGPRKVILPGIILTGLGLFLCAQIQSLIQFYLFFGVIVGMGVICLSSVPSAIILTHWFERRRGTANGLAGVGIGIGILLLVPLFQHLISFRGWRFAYVIFSLLVLAIPLPLNAIFLRNRPKGFDLLQDEDFFKSTHKTVHKNRSRQNEVFYQGVAQEGQTLKKLLKTSRFWFLIFFPTLTGFGVYIIIVHYIRYLVDLGVDPIRAASLFALIGALTAGFRFFWGWFSDRTTREITFTLGGICFSSGILFLLLFQYIPYTVLLYLFAIFFGVGWGVTTPMYMCVSADLYRGRNFGLIYGIVEGVLGIGSAFGAWMGGYIYDQTQNYLWAFILAILMNFISIALVWFAAPRKFKGIQS